MRKKLTRSGNKFTTQNVAQLAGILNKIQLKPETPTDLLSAFQAQYRQLSPEEKSQLFGFMLCNMELSKSEIEVPLRTALADNEDDPLEWTRRLIDLRRRLVSPRMRVFRRFLGTSGGIKFLLDLRADILAAKLISSIDLEPLGEEFSRLLNSWFQTGFLYLQEITPDSSFQLIRYLKEHDFVHPMQSLEEIWGRLGEDRRCFCLYHRAMPEEPIVFIEVALAHGIVRSIHEILDTNGRAATRTSWDTAVFYSINNTQNGLAGMGLAGKLIFDVMEAIRHSHRGIKTFCTLSPIPGFWRRYVKPILEGQFTSFKMTTDKFISRFSQKTRKSLTERYAANTGENAPEFASTLLRILATPGWIEDSVYADLLCRPLTELTHFYIKQEKDLSGKPLNAVANFHMRNGASAGFENINYGANRSERGLQDSCGMMVNYMYSETWFGRFYRKRGVRR